MRTQIQCDTPGCLKPGRLKGRNKRGEKIYGRQCEKHHRAAYSTYPQRIDNTGPCMACGWDSAFCDRHRYVPERGYVPDNVAVLCPNCHRLAGLGLLDMEQVGTIQKPVFAWMAFPSYPKRPHNSGEGETSR